MDLPEPLSDLAALFDEWSLDDPARRAWKMASATAEELASLSQRVLPRLEAIDAYLASFGEAPLPGPARRLILLAEAALEARHELDAREAPGALPG